MKGERIYPPLHKICLHRSWLDSRRYLMSFRNILSTNIFRGRTQKDRNWALWLCLMFVNLARKVGEEEVVTEERGDQSWKHQTQKWIRPRLLRLAPAKAVCLLGEKFKPDFHCEHNSSINKLCCRYLTRASAAWLKTQKDFILRIRGPGTRPVSDILQRSKWGVEYSKLRLVIILEILEIPMPVRKTFTDHSNVLYQQSVMIFVDHRPNFQ